MAGQVSPLWLNAFSCRRFMVGPETPVNTYTAVGADVILMLKVGGGKRDKDGRYECTCQGLEDMKGSNLRILNVSNLETVALEPLTRYSTFNSQQCAQCTEHFTHHAMLCTMHLTTWTITNTLNNINNMTYTLLHTSKLKLLTTQQIVHIICSTVHNSTLG